jgi:hypothetical protein
MALKQANMIKRITASGGGTLEARAGESLRVKRIEVVPSANDTYLTVSVDRTTVAFYRIKGKAGNHLGTLHGAYLKGNIMAFLEGMGINVSIPVPSGQSLSVSRYAEAGNVMIVFDRYDAGDVKDTDPNGPQCREYTLMQYAKVGIAPTASGDAKIDTSLTPTEFPDFPAGATVPAKHNIELLGIAGSPFVDGAAGPVSFATSFLKLQKGREILFDVDRLGIPFDGQDAAATALAYAGNFSLIGPGTETLINTNIVTPGDPLMFDPPISFVEGEELNAVLSVVKTGAATWTANVDDQAFILRVKRL